MMPDGDHAKHLWQIASYGEQILPLVKEVLLTIWRQDPMLKAHNH